MFRSVILFLCAATSLAAQAVTPAVTPPESNLRFEVASIRPNTNISAGMGGANFVRQGRFTITNVPIRYLIAQAFGVSMSDQLIGGPGWTNSARFDITATTELPTPTRAQFQAMLLNLLKDRFQLATHQETRPIDVYELRILKSDGTLGPALRPFTGDCQALRAVGRGCNASGSGQSPYTAVGMTLGMLYEGQLGGVVERRIVDRTGLTGLFEWDLRAENNLNDVSAPSIFTALQEQLGLKLVPNRIPFDVIVIDRIEPPTPN